MGDFSYLDSYLKKLVDRGPAGCGCAVARDGEVLFENYYGWADLEKRIPVTDQSIFRQFSSTKVIVCTAAMMLFERGGFLLDDPISEYFPEWDHTMVAEKGEDGLVRLRPVKRPIQVRDCFTMAMGIGYGGDDYTHQRAKQVREKLASENPYYTLRDDIRAMAEVPVAFDPGTHWLYGFGHELVAGLIEVVSGKTVGEFLREEIFEPLEMKNTGYRFTGTQRERMVTAYLRGQKGEMTPIPGPLDRLHEPEARYEGGGAGLFSTVSDYLKFSQALACGGRWKDVQLIGRKTIDLMRTNQLNEQQRKDFTFPYVEGYGYGFGVRTLMQPVNGSTSLGEFGWTGAMGTYTAIDPSERVSVVYMHNLQPNMEMEVHSRVRNMAFGAIR